MAQTGKFGRVGPLQGSTLAACLVLVLSLAAYSNSFDAAFHFDDFHQVVKNQNIRSLDNLPRFFTDAGMGSYHAELKGYRPVTYASFALNYALSGYSVRGYHAVNFTLHVFNALLVFLVVAAVLKYAGREAGFYPALTASLIFALHPVQTNAVTYVSGRAVLLASFFYLAAFYAFLRFREGRGGISLAWAAASPILYLSGLLSKEMAVSLPAAMLVYDLIFTVPKRGGLGKSFKAGLYYLPFMVALLSFLSAKRLFQGYVAVPDIPYGVGEYLMSESKAVLLYARVLLLPINQNVDYDLPAASSVDGLVVLSLALIAIVLFLLYRLRKNAPATAFFGSWFFIAIAPESTLIPITDIAVEYRLYLPAVGLAAVLALLVSKAAKPRAAKAGVAVAVSAMLLILTFNRNTVWATEYTLWRDVAGKSAHSARAHANLGNALMNERRYAEAVGELDRSLRINPFYDQSYNVFGNLGICFYELGMLDEAVLSLERAIAVYPGYVEAYGNLGAMYYKTGRYSEAAAVLLKATKIDPGYALAHYNLAQSYSRLGRHGDALAEIVEARRLSPRDFDVNYKAALIHEDNGMRAEAAGLAEAALGLAADGQQRGSAAELLDRLRVDGRRAKD